MTTKTCMCRIPTDECAIPRFIDGDALAEWCRVHDVEILADHQNRPSVDIATAYRLRDESGRESERNIRATQQARREHVAAVAQLREDIALAFIEQAGGAAGLADDGSGVLT